MEDANKLFNDAIDSVFSNNPTIAGDGFKYKRMINNEDAKLNGGKATNKNLSDIERKHNKTKDTSEYIKFLKKQLHKGANVEKEHTDNIKIARQIAKDHLWEDPKYYDGRKKFQRITRFFTILLALFQSFALARFLDVAQLAVKADSVFYVRTVLVS